MTTLITCVTASLALLLFTVVEGAATDTTPKPVGNQPAVQNVQQGGGTVVGGASSTKHTKEWGETCAGKDDDSCLSQYTCKDNKCACPSKHCFKEGPKVCIPIQCPGKFEAHGNKCYKFVKEPRWQIGAIRACQHMSNSKLAEPRTESQNDVIDLIVRAKYNLGLIPEEARQQVWLGGKKDPKQAGPYGDKPTPKGPFQWLSDDTKVDDGWTKWGALGHNNWREIQDCMAYHREHTWNDYTCWFPLPFICEVHGTNQHADLKCT